MSTSFTRGIRNNNPGNIRRNPANKWQGRVPLDRQTDPDFEQFVSAEYGIRALAVTLITYQDRYGLRTIRQLIGRWAPPTENDTGAYVRAVARRVGRGPDEPLDVHRYEDLRPLIEAIVAHENADFRYPGHVIDRGLELAGVTRGGRAVLETDTVRGSTAAASATAVSGAVATVAPQLWGLDWRVAVAIVVVVAIAAVAGVIAWRARRS